MDWVQVLTIVFANLGMFLWSRSESRADHRMAIELIQAIKDEVKDFHGRLCTIESNKK